MIKLRNNFIFVCLLLLFGIGPLEAAFEPVWVIGTRDDSFNEFGSESFTVEAAPGSATTRDDHFYFGGNYPAPIGLAESEPFENFERAITSGDRFINIYTRLTGQQANPRGRFRLTAYFVWSGSVAGRETLHDLVFRINGVAFATNNNFRGEALLSAEVDASLLAINTETPLTVQIERVGGTPDAWLGIDHIRLDLDPTANTDDDLDGFPRYWEERNGFSDANANDVIGDFDGDGLSAGQERNLNTHPKVFDTDGDGLSDGEETLSNPLVADTDGDGLNDLAELRHPISPTDPMLVDSDGDTAPDGWELQLGSDPTSAASRPPELSGTLGIQFVSGHPDMGFRSLSATTVAGVIPQINWNSTYPLIPWGVGSSSPMRSGTSADVKSPASGLIVNGAGTATTVAIDIQYNGCWASANTPGTFQRLMNGYLLARSTDPARLTMANVPYTNYHVFVYVAADYIGPISRIRVNGNTGSEIIVRPLSVAPQSIFLRARPATTNRNHFGNYACFTNLTSASLVVEVFQVENNSGLSGIQIVDAMADFDGDQLPDWWELRHRLNPGLGGDQSRDDDQDGLINSAEFTRGTDPRKADTDGDGLTDLAETGTGTFVHARNTGSNPLEADSDGDQIADGEEVTGLFPSNPNLVDTDGDGVGDHAELRQRGSPAEASIGRLPIPVFNSADGSMTWEIRQIQLRWNHDIPWETETGSTRQMLQLHLENATEPSSQALLMGLWARHNSLGAYFRLNNTGGFYRAASPGSDVWHADWNGVIDQSALVGFSGHGAHDFSDFLAFRIHATPGTTGIDDWTVSMSVSNETTGLTVTNHVESNLTAAASIRNQTAVWRSVDNNVIGESDFRLGIGTSFYRSAIPLETRPRYAQYRDTDNDGLPDAWETAHGLNPNAPADATADTEPDGLSNLAEYRHGSDPAIADTDGDGVPDGIEVSHFSDPADAGSRPFTLPSSISLNGDGNRNGLPDIWETRYQASSLIPGGDDDNDGVPNWREAVMGTDPRVPSVRFEGRVSRLPNQAFELRWPYFDRKGIRIFSGSNLLSFAQMTTPPTRQGGDLVCTVNGLQPEAYFHATLTELDSDNDGLSDWAEIRLGSETNSANSLRRAVLYDSTGDGVADRTLSGDYAASMSRFGNTGQPTGGNQTNNPPTETAAARLLMQSTFGPTRADIARVRRLGVAGWIDDQIENQPTTRHRDYIEEIFRDFDGPRTALNYSFNAMSDFVNGENVQTAFARAAISGTDQLRQRVAFALSQIFVISRQDGNLQNRPRGLASYYDICVTNAFANYHDILRAVTFHPAMGRYLSHLGNQPPAPEISRFPDENYAREVMQLFSIGLWELNPDGTRQLNNAGQPIPTYSNDEITHLARVMTGFWYGGNPWGSGGWQDEDFASPMNLHADYHDFDRKVLPGGKVIPSRSPSRANARRDVEDALRMLFEHPNTPTFIGKSLIQFLVTDNPSTNFVRRIHDIFVNNGSGVRGDLAAVVRAILLDAEARDPVSTEMNPQFGRMREPVVRAMHLARLTKLNRNGNLLWYDSNFHEAAFQAPLMAPTVFNFFRPDYQPPGVLKDGNLVGPVFQITTSYSALSFPNFLWRITNRGFTHWVDYAFPPDLRDELALADDVEALLDHVNLLVCGGRMAAGTRRIIRDGLNATDLPVAKARLAIYLALMSAEGAVQR